MAFNASSVVSVSVLSTRSARLWVHVVVFLGGGGEQKQS